LQAMKIKTWRLSRISGGVMLRFMLSFWQS
jgi:hypothetical protein